MIGDLCKPFNPGEHPTIRVAMSLEEAERLRSWLQGIRTSEGTAARELERILERTLKEQGRP